MQRIALITRFVTFCVFFFAGAGAWVLGLGGLVVGSGVFLLAALLLGSPEPAGLLRAVRRRRG